MKIFILIISAVLSLNELVFNQNAESFDTSNRDSFGTHLQTLITRITQSQTKKSTVYSPRKSYPPLKSWERQKGLFDSFVHLNFHGKRSTSFLRNAYKFPDDNGFVTIFVVEALTASAQFYPGLNLDENILLDALEAISKHQDKNFDFPVMCFWNQVEVSLNNKTAYRQTAQNIAVPLSEGVDGVRMVAQWLKFVGLEKYAKQLSSVSGLAEMFIKVLSIPSDADDTGVNLALGYTLLNSKKLFPTSFQKWAENNQDEDNNIFSFYDQYTYRPFSDNYAENSIDPRTYFWIKDYLFELKKTKSEKQLRNIKFITTYILWLQQLNDVEKQKTYRKMPFQVNNVDASVVANSLYGMVSKMVHAKSLTSYLKYQDLLTENIDFLTWIITNRVVEKYQVVVLLYYPPKFAFYWFVARLLHTLRQLPNNNDEFCKTIHASVKNLHIAMTTIGTNEILKSVEHEEIYYFWDDFLGNADFVDETPSPSFDDRIFSTGMAINALLDIWTIRREYEGIVNLEFIENTPAKVSATIYGASYWLKDQSHLFPRENAFFSGSVKQGESSNTYLWPHNSFIYANGTNAGPCSLYNSTSAIPVFAITSAVSGVVDQDAYQELVDTQMCFGKKTGVAGATISLNCPGCTFPYWSSPALTDAIHVLALTKVSALKL